MARERKDFIYLDHNATTPVDPEAVKAMQAVMEEEFGNPSSAYVLGIRAKEIFEESREEIAKLLDCSSTEIVFTSGGSESNNMVLKGLIDFSNPKDSHIIVSAIEHPAVLNTALFLMGVGVRVTILPVDGFGLVDPERLRKEIRPNTVLISIMLANNETGTLEPIREVSKIAKEYGVPLNTDAAQAVGKNPVSVNELGVDFLTVAGHKLYGPKGVGVLFIKQKRELTPLIHGAGQEFGRRAGTESTILATGLGMACRIARGRVQEDARKTKAMRDKLQTLLFDALDDIVVNGHPERRLPNTLNISIPGIEGKKILDGLPRLMCSTGAACHDRSVKLSYVLSAMSIPPEVGMGALRLSVGRSNTMAQVEEAAAMIINRVKEIRESNQSRT